MYLHISNICINLVEQLRDITNLEVAHDTDKVHRIMTNEAKLNEAIKLFKEWSNTYRHELVTIRTQLHTIDVTLIHECAEDVAELVANAANQKVQGQLAAYVQGIEDSENCSISIVWMKED